MSRRTRRRRKRRPPRRDCKICSKRYRPPKRHLGSAFERFCSKDCMKVHDATKRLGEPRLIESYEQFQKLFGIPNGNNFPKPYTPVTIKPQVVHIAPSWKLTQTITTGGTTVPSPTKTFTGDSVGSSGLRYSSGTG